MLFIPNNNIGKRCRLDVRLVLLLVWTVFVYFRRLVDAESAHICSRRCSNRHCVGCSNCHHNRSCRSDRKQSIVLSLLGQRRPES